MIRAVQGMITGLVCITPAAGVVQAWAAIIMGTIARQVDDPMAVFHTHAVSGSGVLGGILTGFFAVPKLCRLFYMVPEWGKYIGLAYGLQIKRTSAGFKKMGIQLCRIIFVICLNVIVTSLICFIIRLVMPLRMSKDGLKFGASIVHGEKAFRQEP